MQYYKLNEDFCKVACFADKELNEGVYKILKDKVFHIKQHIGIEDVDSILLDGTWYFLTYEYNRDTDTDTYSLTTEETDLIFFTPKEVSKLIKVDTPKSEVFYTPQGKFNLVIRTKEFIIGTDSLDKEHVFSLDKELTAEDAVDSILCDLDYYSDIPLVNQLQEKGFKIVPIN